MRDCVSSESIVKSVDTYLVPVLEKHMKKEKAKKVSRSIGVIVALVVLITVVSTLINMLIPELITSIRNLIFTLPAQINQLVKEINNIQLDDSTTTAVLKNAMNEASASLQKWMRTDLLDKVNEVMTHLTVGLYTLIMEMFHAVIGVIVSVYILFGKETFINQSKKAAYAIFPAERANLLIHIAVKTNEIFGGFIIGKIIDSIIIGILCFIGTSILKMPYAMLVSVIVGVTNVIPFFGPYIGAIPSAVLIALADPMKGIYFLIFILLLQQFDGNILGPKILGNSTGLSAFWVIVSILLGGGLFGILGMLFGVPTFAVVYYIIKLLLDNQLEKKKLPTDSDCYNGDSYVDNDGTYFQKRDDGAETEEQKIEKNKEEKGNKIMPIRVQNDLPVKEILESENIFVMDEHRATHQDIRPIKIGLLNLMPLKEETELQILRSLSNTPLQVDVTFVAVASHQSKNTSKSHLNKFYQTFDEIKDRKFDGFIITGAPVEQMPFEEVDYWDELTRIMDWTKTNVVSTLHLCWGAQAGMYYHYGIDKVQLDKKAFGLFWHKVLNRKIPLVRGFDDVFLAPHSRHTETPLDKVRADKRITILAESDEVGLFLAMAQNGRQIFVMGHPEYDRVTLDGEYKRDKSKGLPIELPKNYYQDDDPENGPLLTWRATANNLYTNWLNYYVYQATPYDLEGTPDFIWK